MYALAVGFAVYFNRSLSKVKGTAPEVPVDWI